jgi:hypothetical protein
MIIETRVLNTITSCWEVVDRETIQPDDYHCIGFLLSEQGPLAIGAKGDAPLGTAVQCCLTDPDGKLILEGEVVVLGFTKGSIADYFAKSAAEMDEGL